MGILDKIKSTVSRTDSNGTRGTVPRLATVAVAAMMLLSVFAGGAAADALLGVSSTDINSGDTTQFVTVDIDGSDYAVGQLETITVNASGVDYTSATAIETQSGDFEVDLTNYNSTSQEFEIVVNKTASTPDSSLQLEVSNYSVTSDGTDGQVMWTDGNTTYTDSFSYSASTSTPATGSISIDSVTENDTGNETNFSYEVINSNGTVVANGSDVSAPVSVADLETGDYTVDVFGVANYDDASQSVSVTENNTSSVNFSLARTQLDAEVTVEDNGSAVESFDISIYDGDSIGDNESAVASATVTDNDSNVVTFSGLDAGATYTFEVNYTDADGNEVVYTETVTIDESQAVNGTVSQTLDVSSDSTSTETATPTDDSSDDGGFVGGAQDGVTNFIDQLQNNPISVLLGALTVIGAIFAVFWVIIGLLANRPRY